jgi:hypothetical protein
MSTTIISTTTTTTTATTNVQAQQSADTAESCARKVTETTATSTKIVQVKRAHRLLFPMVSKLKVTKQNTAVEEASHRTAATKVASASASASDGDETAMDDLTSVTAIVAAAADDGHSKAMSAANIEVYDMHQEREEDEKEVPKVYTQAQQRKPFIREDDGDDDDDDEEEEEAGEEEEETETVRERGRGGVLHPRTTSTPAAGTTVTESIRSQSRPRMTISSNSKRNPVAESSKREVRALSSSPRTPAKLRTYGDSSMQSAKRTSASSAAGSGGRRMEIVFSSGSMYLEPIDALRERDESTAKIDDDDDDDEGEEEKQVVDAYEYTISDDSGEDEDDDDELDDIGRARGRARSKAGSVGGSKGKAKSAARGNKFSPSSTGSGASGRGHGSGSGASAASGRFYSKGPKKTSGYSLATGSNSAYQRAGTSLMLPLTRTSTTNTPLSASAGKSSGSLGSRMQGSSTSSKGSRTAITAAVIDTRRESFVSSSAVTGRPATKRKFSGKLTLHLNNALREDEGSGDDDSSSEPSGHCRYPRTTDNARLQPATKRRYSGKIFQSARADRVFDDPFRFSDR